MCIYHYQNIHRIDIYQKLGILLFSLQNHLDNVFR